MSGLLGGLRRRLFGRAGTPPLATIDAPLAAEEAAQPVAAPPRRSAEIGFFHLRTSGGRWLGVAEGRLVATAKLDPAYAAIALLPAAAPGRALLFGSDLGRFRIEADTAGGAASAALVMPTDLRGTVRLKYPVAGQAFLTADPDQPGRVLFAEGGGGTIHAVFTLVALEATAVPTQLRAASGEVGALAAEGLRAAPLAERLRRGTLRPDFAEALARLLPADELEALSALLVEQPAHLAAWARALPGDVWLNRVLPALAGWERQGRPPAAGGGRLHSPADDEAALLPTRGRGHVPLGLALTGLARRRTRPDRLACVLATARNEGPYLLDWVAYHLSIGFEHIFLYGNDNTDGSDALTGALAAHGVLTAVDNARGPRLGPQDKAYAHALTVLPQVLDYRWTAVLDVDEYFGFDAGLFDGVADFIALHECQPVDAVALCWLVFAAGPGERWSDVPTPLRFPFRESAVNPHVKTLFRTRLFWSAQPHFPVPTLDRDYVYRTQDGHLHHHPGVGDRIPAFAERPAATQAWVNHYFARTAPEALWKWGRGRADWIEEGPDSRLAFLELIATSFLRLARPEHLVEDTRILACASRFEAERAKLLALPGVADADAASKSRFAAELGRQTDAFLATKLPEGASDSIRHFKELLAL